MEIKIFGKKMFEVNSTKGGIFLNQGTSAAKESKYLPDFYQGSGNANNDISNFVITSVSGGGAVAVPIQDVKSSKKVKEEIRLTPKGVYELKMLNEKSFKLNVDPKYVDEQITSFKDKLGLIKAEEYDMRHGVNEIASVLLRLENRKKYKDVAAFFDEFPYTTTTKIDKVLKDNGYLKIGQVAQFLADMPKEAVSAMNDYNKHTKQICSKQAVFYIVADKKDFQKTSSRRDPILLAQSPFGHFWQILGAWDKEMLLLENL